MYKKRRAINKHYHQPKRITVIIVAAIITLVIVTLPIFLIWGGDL